MISGSLRVLVVNTSVRGGGAQRVALSLHAGLRRRGHGSWLAVGRRNMDVPGAMAIPGAGRRSVLNAIADFMGREPFDYPGTRQLLGLSPEPIDLIHGHNLHGRFFDLRELPALSRRVPVALTLHDEWTYTGHCAYPMALENWRTGCHSCPDREVYPAIRRDATHANWEAKRRIWATSRVSISAPSHWLISRAKESILAPAATDWRVIPNGVDLDLYRPGAQEPARELLGLPREARILLFTANRVASTPFKDVHTIFAAGRALAGGMIDRPLLILALGDRGPSEHLGTSELRFVPYVKDERRLAAFYRAADLYLHAAHADNLPTTILEALASGLPVVATAVGGIPEEVRSLGGVPGAWDGASYAADIATGVLVRHGDANGMAAAAAALLASPETRSRLAANAAADAAARFDVERYLDTTLMWYSDVVQAWRLQKRGEQAPLA